MVTLAQLESQIQKLQRRADAMREQKSVEVIAKIRSMMDEYGLTTADLAKAGSGSGNKRGRKPGTKTSASSKNGAAKTTLPAKYRDPESGATWSGHARPPAWIKDAPDRSVYLIDGASNKKRALKKGRAAVKKTARRNARSAAA
ncbi:histone family protein nucleoid-structuring protein H-NS [Caballeronia fortuita]|uniref:Histone family protein nucleoid-structuring protein H-NS n=1 Tax=Caballeronia fortuita TaxID=1777138 RepID=A0A158AAD0_9BURK|nr:H-NS histone family protein [Caballeronia fortuita]SAK54689.1 histone family protein nucleoid-structuring protein H-NS [Caballeronia fortuita]